jgi:hypothetical protein
MIMWLDVRFFNGLEQEKQWPADASTERGGYSAVFL